MRCRNTEQFCQQIRAKSVLLRDLNQLKTQNQLPNQAQNDVKPQPVESQSKSPMAIDLDSSPVAVKEEPFASDANTKPAAPFPDMGMGIGAVDIPKDISQVPTTSTDAATKVKTEDDGPSTAAQELVVDAKQEPATNATDDSLGMGGADLNFTDIQFTLAPGNDSTGQSGGDGAPSGNGNEPSFDLTSFGATDGASGNLASLENILPTEMNDQPPSAPTVTDGATAVANGQPGADGDKKAELPDSEFADIFAGDGEADGMDFDFSLGDDGMGGDTFDDLMNDRDNTFDTMEHGDFDNSFFGLDKIEES